MKLRLPSSLSFSILSTVILFSLFNASPAGAISLGQAGPVDLSPVVTVSAGAISPSPSISTCKTTFWEDRKGEFERFLSGLTSLIGGQPVVERVEHVNKANLPPGLGQSSSVQNCEDDSDANTLANASYQHSLADSTKNIKQTPGEMSFFLSLFASIAGLFTEGNKNATEWVAGGLPSGVGEQLMAQQMRTTDLAQVDESNDPRVLAAETQSSVPMEVAYGVNLCGNLPPALCRDNKPIGVITVTPGLSITPSPSGGPGPTLTYEISYYKNDLYSSGEINSSADTFLSNVSKLVAAIKKKWPTSMINYKTGNFFMWKEIYDASIAKNWNPVFVLAVWIEETAASDVCTLQQRQGVNGIYDLGYFIGEKTYCDDTDQEKLQKLKHQYEGFLGLYTFYQGLYKKDTISFEEFMCKYNEGSFAPCTFGHAGFVQRLPLVYNCLINPNPSAANCPAGYFTF